MKIHLVGGFLGSGKTTAISNACKLLSENNISSSVITNDQGEYLVDSNFIQSLDIPNGEVSGGCFCCNYNDLESQIDELKEKYNPDVIFAESVGSCTDLVATVLRPLIKFRGHEIEQITFSGFVDSQLFLPYLQGNTLPFSGETNYIWEKQIEEADTLIVNKIDLLTSEDLEKLKRLAKDAFPKKKLIFQNSCDLGSVNNWIEHVAKDGTEHEFKSVQVDYKKYAIGEANLAWLDEEIEVQTEDESAVEYVLGFIQSLTSKIEKLKLPIGHLKYLLSVNGEYHKVSYTTVINKSDVPQKIGRSNKAHLLVNARIHTDPNEIRDVFIKALDDLKSIGNIDVIEKHLSYFQPGEPVPTYRLT